MRFPSMLALFALLSGCERSPSLKVCERSTVKQDFPEVAEILCDCSEAEARALAAIAKLEKRGAPDARIEAFIQAVVAAQHAK